MTFIELEEFSAEELLEKLTWLAIKFQLGVVPPELSIAYRFFAASALLLLASLVMKRNLKFPLKVHGYLCSLPNKREYYSQAEFCALRILHQASSTIDKIMFGFDEQGMLF